jgi:serine/threonine protein kinase
MVEKRPRTSIPDRIGRYEILGLIGSGGMGVVYRGRDPRLKRVVAIKQLTEGFRDNPDMMARFYAEAEKQAQLDHRNIVVVYEAGDQDGDPYIVMQFVDGETLKEKLNAGKRLELRLVLSVVEQVCLALAYAHRKQLIHRDVKPANIIVQPDETAKLFDFGIAREESGLDRTLTHTGVIVGTPAYMAPERFKGVSVDGRSDLFSAGVLLYELLTGKSPFEAPDVHAVGNKVSSYEPPALSTVLSGCPPSLDAILARALAKSPLDRYATGDDMARDLREANADLVRGQVAEFMAQAESLFDQRQFLSAQSALHKVLMLDSQNSAGKALLQRVALQITQYERERKAREFARLAQKASDDYEWDRALTLCKEALMLVPQSATLVSLQQAIVDRKQVQEKVSQILFEIAGYRKRGRLEDALRQITMAQELDPTNSQILALSRELELEAENHRLREELQTLLASFHEHLDAQAFDHAELLLNRAKSIAPDDPEVLHAQDDLELASLDDRRRTLVRRIEDRVALARQAHELRAVLSELATAVAEFPNDPSLFRLRRTLEPKIRQLEIEELERETLRKAAELPPESALSLVSEALRRMPGNARLLQRQQELTERAERARKDRILSQRLADARQAIEDGHNGEAVRTLERLKSEGYASHELDEFLEIAKTPDGEQPLPKPIQRTYSQAKEYMDVGNYSSATEILRRAIMDDDHPVLGRLLEEAKRMLQTTGQQAARAMQSAERLMTLGMFAEAVTFLQKQPIEVQRLPEIDVAMRRAKVLQQGEEETFRLMGRCYAQLGENQSVEEMRKMMTFDTIDDEQGTREAAKARFRDRCHKVHSDKAANVISKARRFLLEADSQGAAEILGEAMSWIDLAPQQSQDEVRALHAEASGRKKLFGFREASRR